MTLVRWNPINHFGNDFINVHREFDRLFDQFRGGVVDENHSSVFMPAVDIVERKEDYLVKLELPGVNKDDVKITIHNDVLTIQGEKKQEKETKEDNYQRIERAYGSFRRSFTLPSSVKNEKIDATYNDGILTVMLPKAEEAKPKEIEVKVK